MNIGVNLSRTVHCCCCCQVDPFKNLIAEPLQLFQSADECSNKQQQHTYKIIRSRSRRKMQNSFRRSLSTSIPPRVGSISTPKPSLRRTKDPLTSSPVAQHFVLPSGSQFIVRPPPSSLPASFPIPSTSSRTPFGPVDTNPSALFSAAPSSPFLTTSSLEHLLPAARQPSSTSSRQLSAGEVAELQSLRRSHPETWTRSKLAEKFGISQQVVGTLGWGEGQEARDAEKARARQITEERDEVEGKWGWKKAIAREERRRRRALW